MAIQVPSIWDYLGQGIGAGIQGYQGRKAEQREEEQRRLNIMQQLFAQGAIDSSQLNAAGQRAGMDLGVQANPAEMRRKIMAARDTNIQLPNMFGGAQGAAGAINMPGQNVKIAGADQFTDAQRSFAGVPTSHDVRKQRSESTQLDLQDRTAAIKQKFASGQPLTAEESEFIGADTPGQRQSKRLMEIEKPMAAAANRYVSEAILTTNGRLNPKQLSQLSESSFNRWLQDRAGGKSMNLTPDEEIQARGYFAEAVRTAYIDQQDRDIRKMVADASVDRANRPTGTGGSPAATINALGNISTREQKAADAMLEGNPMLAHMASRPIDQVPARYQASVLEYKRRIQSAQELNQASALYAAGQITPDQANSYLHRYADPAGPAGAAPAGGGTGPISLRPPSDAGMAVPTVPSLSDAQINQAAMTLRNMNAADRKAYIENAQAQGAISPADLEKLRKKVSW